MMDEIFVELYSQSFSVDLNMVYC